VSGINTIVVEPERIFYSIFFIPTSNISCSIRIRLNTSTIDTLLYIRGLVLGKGHTANSLSKKWGRTIGMDSKLGSQTLMSDSFSIVSNLLEIM
jgi:hypothetical protein